jgi:hypothetical protein
MDTGVITGLFIGIMIFIIITIFVATMFGVGQISLFFIILILVFVSIIGIKAAVLSGKRDINTKDLADIAVSTIISVSLVVGSTMMASSKIEIISRAFENTLGYWWINNDTLAQEMANVFNKPAELNINLIITQMFTTDDKKEFDNYIQNFNVAQQFSGVTVKENDVDTTNLYDNFVVKKNLISKATVASLATIIAMYTSYMPITTPWINV